MFNVAAGGLGLSRAPGKRSGSPWGWPFSVFPGLLTARERHARKTMAEEGMPPPVPASTLEHRRPTSFSWRHPFCLRRWPFPLGNPARGFRIVALAGVEATIECREGHAPGGSHDASGRYGSADRHSVVRGSELACRLSRRTAPLTKHALGGPGGLGIVRTGIFPAAAVPRRVVEMLLTSPRRGGDGENGRSCQAVISAHKKPHSPGQ